MYHRTLVMLRCGGLSFAVAVLQLERQAPSFKLTRRCTDWLPANGMPVAISDADAVVHIQLELAEKAQGLDGVLEVEFGDWGHVTYQLPYGGCVQCET